MKGYPGHVLQSRSGAWCYCKKALSIFSKQPSFQILFSDTITKGIFSKQPIKNYCFKDKEFIFEDEYNKQRNFYVGPKHKKINYLGNLETRIIKWNKKFWKVQENKQYDK